MASYNTGFAPTLVPPLVPLPVFHPAASIPFSFACPPNPSTSAAPLAGSSSASSSRHASLQARRLPRGPPPPASSTARRPRTSRLSGAVERRDVVSGRQGSQQREHLRHEHEGGLERLLEGRAPLGVDLAAEKRDLSEEEQDEEYRDQAIRDFGHTFLAPIGICKTQEELDAVQTRTPSPTPPSNAEDSRPFQHANHARHEPHRQYREPSVEVPDVDQMRDLDDDLDDEDADSAGDEDDEDDDLEAGEDEYEEYGDGEA